MSKLTLIPPTRTGYNTLARERIHCKLLHRIGYRSLRMHTNGHMHQGIHCYTRSSSIRTDRWSSFSSPDEKTTVLLVSSSRLQLQVATPPPFSPPLSSFGETHRRSASYLPSHLQHPIFQVSKSSRMTPFPSSRTAIITVTHAVLQYHSLRTPSSADCYNPTGRRRVSCSVQ